MLLKAGIPKKCNQNECKFICLHRSKSWLSLKFLKQKKKQQIQWNDFSVVSDETDSRKVKKKKTNVVV